MNQRTEYVVFIISIELHLVFEYSRTSSKRPPKMSSLGGRLREVVAYEKSSHRGSQLHMVFQCIIHAASYIPSGRLREVNNNRKFQTVISKSGRGRLQEVVNYERFHRQ